MECIPATATGMRNEIPQPMPFRATKALQEQDAALLFHLDRLLSRLGTDRSTICASTQRCRHNDQMAQMSQSHLTILIR
jgi:hypothetical protein